jgi:Protein of unknown function (DUF2934)
MPVLRVQCVLVSSKTEVNTAMSDANSSKFPSHDEIAVRAYEIFVERGSIPGDDVSNWLEAEAELSQATAIEAETRTKPESRIVDSPISAPAVSGLRSRATVA